MTDFELEATATREAKHAAPDAHVDFALSAQLIVAWAGEAADPKRLAWWRSDLVSEFGGEDLFRRLLPSTWRWAVLQGAREAARRVDAERRQQDHDADRLVSLYSFGVELDERLDERLQDLKRMHADPAVALPALARLQETWSRDWFAAWVSEHGQVTVDVTPAGRRIKDAVPTSLDDKVRVLIAGLAPLADDYPLPHFRRAP